jgi:diguanylate cyclase (GGDEF)-like protein
LAQSTQDNENLTEPARSGRVRVRTGRRPYAETLIIAAVLYSLTAVLLLVMPDSGTSTRPSGWWAAIAIAIAFAASEQMVLRFEFRREVMTLSFSEVPMAFAMVFLLPGVALGARFVGSIAVLLVLRRSAAYKIFFNLGLFSLELALSFLLFRTFLGWWGTGDAQLVVAAIVAISITSTLGSVVVSLAISRFEGDVIGRIKARLSVAWWLFIVTSMLAGMVLSLALIAPGLVLLAIAPLGLLWYVTVAYGSLQQRLWDLDAVHGFTARVGQSLEPGRIGDEAVNEASRLLRSESAGLVVFDVSGSSLIKKAGPWAWELPAGPDEPAWAALAHSKSAQLVSRRQLEEFGIAAPAGRKTEMIVAPIYDDSGPLGLLAVAGRSGPTRTFSEADVAHAQNLTEQLSSSLRKGMLHQRIEKEARHDGLTGLPNRSSFERSVIEIAADRPKTGLLFVLMLDLDRFKEVNDTLGHHAGDELLIEVSRRMSTQVAHGDVLARLAGDEFAVLGHRESREAMIALANACITETGRPVTLDGLEIVVTASAGLAVLDASDFDANGPLRHADIAMYNAKTQRLGVEVYREEIDRRTPARLSMLGDLRAAIENHELHVNYQPKLDLNTGMIIGAEALVRWTHAVRGVVPPIQFVRVAEDTGLIKQLTDLMLSRGIGTLRDVHRRGFHLGLAVNLSTHDLLDTRLARRVDEHLSANGVEPGMLTLEITESSLLIDAPRARATINELNDVGVRMSIDDFGTGYSSLSYLRRLPVRELKIDRSFVANVLLDEQDEVIVRSTIDLGHNLGLEVVAEGVENNEVLDRLRGFGCDVAQGFCISRPLDADRFLAWLSTTSHPSRSLDPLSLDEWQFVSERDNIVTREPDPAT